MSRVSQSTAGVLAAAALVGLALSASASGALAGASRSTAVTLTTTITKAAIHPAKHSARFTFVVTGGSSTTAVAFRCDLARHGYVVGPPRPCTSPKGYGSLQSGTYTFSVYAIDTTGDRSNTATHDFTIL
ncbi:MAG: hypothetical protein ACXVRZ_04145 [Gaiellaceae bacterium]